jgi:hypothetical protein
MNIIQPSLQACISIGGRVFTDLDNLIMLYGWTAGSTTIRTSLRLANGTAGYQVPASRTLKIMAAKIVPCAATPTGQVVATPCYSDNDVGMESSTAFTNPIYLGGDVGMGLATAGASDNYPEFGVVLDFDVPTGKYPGFQGGACVTSLIFYGYLRA